MGPDTSPEWEVVVNTSTCRGMSLIRYDVMMNGNDGNGPLDNQGGQEPTPWGAHSSKSYTDICITIFTLVAMRTFRSNSFFALANTPSWVPTTMHFPAGRSGLCLRG